MDECKGCLLKVAASRKQGPGLILNSRLKKNKLKRSTAPFQVLDF